MQSLSISNNTQHLQEVCGNVRSDIFRGDTQQMVEAAIWETLGLKTEWSFVTGKVLKWSSAQGCFTVALYFTAQ